MPTYSFFGYAPSALSYDAVTNSFTFDANYSHATGRVQFEVTDDDTSLDGDEHNDEVGEDSNQTGIVRTPDGHVISSGAIYGEERALIEAGDGTQITIDRIEIAGQLVGYMPSQPLQPGVTYSYISSGDIDNALASESGADTRKTYADYQAFSVPCFGPDTRIETRNGPRPINTLRRGDLVLTRDHGLQPVLWISRSTAHPDDQRANPGIRPVMVLDDNDGLILSGNHRVLISDPGLELLFGTREVFASAKDMARVGLARRHRFTAPIDYTHLLLDRHQVVRANGVWVESLLASEAVLGHVPPILRAHLTNVLADVPPVIQTARMCLNQREVSLLAACIPEFRRVA